MSTKACKKHFARKSLGAGRFMAWCGQTVPAERVIQPNRPIEREDACRLCFAALRRSSAAAHRERMQHG